MYKNILIIAPSWIGDCIMAQSLFQVLRDTRSNIKIDVYANKNLFAIFDKMPQINNIICNPFFHGEIKLFKRYKEGLKLKNNNYDQVIILPGSLKSVLVPFFAKIPIRTGFSKELRGKLLTDARFLERDKLVRMVDRYVSLAFSKNSVLPVSIPVPKLNINNQVRDRIVTKFKFIFKSTGNKKVVSFCPGADYGAAKRWPYKYFAKLAQYFYENNYIIWIFGSSLDFDIGESIVNSTFAKCINLCGATDLDEAIYLLSFSDLVISNDTGLMHISCALEVPTIAIYGSTSYEHTPCLSSKSKSLSLNLECSPCFKRICPLGHFNCMNSLLPEFVFEESLKIIDLE